MDEKVQSQAEETPTQVMTINRIFDTTPERLWAAWTDPELFKRWWGGKDFTCPACKIDLRVGGKYIACMRSPDGQDIWSGGVFREIIPTSRLVFTDMFTDPEGNLIPASQYGMGADWPDVLLITLNFSEPEPGKTLLTLRHEGMPEGQDQDLTSEGWRQSFDKLAKLMQE